MSGEVLDEHGEPCERTARTRSYDGSPRTQAVGRVIHNPWAALVAWVTLFGMMFTGVAIFYGVDKRVVRNDERIRAFESRHQQEIRHLRGRMADLRGDVRSDRVEILKQLHALDVKLDDINRYLRDLPTTKNHASPPRGGPATYAPSDA